VLSSSPLPATVSPAAVAAVYDVGPGQPYAAIGDVPWEALGPGDVVQIHWRSTPYKEKWVIGRQGTAAAPIVVRGIPGPAASVRSSTATAPPRVWPSTTPRKAGRDQDRLVQHSSRHHSQVHRSGGLHVTGARSGRSFTDDGGGTQSYSANASTIYVEKGENITVRDCELTDSGNGFFVASSDALASRNILVEGCFIHDNGNVGSIFEHNLYVAGIGMTFQHNRLGPLLAGASGKQPQDRSAGLVVRYKLDRGREPPASIWWTARTAVSSVPTLATGRRTLRQRPGRARWRRQPPAHPLRRRLRTTANYRKGTLWLYNNTSSPAGRMPIAPRSCACPPMPRPATPGTTSSNLPRRRGTSLSLMDTDGVLRFSHNWVEPGYRVSFGTFTGTVNRRRNQRDRHQPGLRERAGTGPPPDRRIRPVATPVRRWIRRPSHAGGRRRYVVHQSATGPSPGRCAGPSVPTILQCGSAGSRLRPALRCDRQTLRWTAAAEAQAYDVLRGSLEVLRGSAGDSTTPPSDACPADDLAVTRFADAVVPPRVSGTFWLVRGVGCGGLGGGLGRRQPAPGGLARCRDLPVGHNPGVDVALAPLRLDPERALAGLIWSEVFGASRPSRSRWASARAGSC
jgi:hypothetical protein